MTKNGSEKRLRREGPVRTKPIGYGRQCIEDDDVEAVARVLRSDYLTQGPAVAAFERAFAERVGRRHAVAFANGTAALHGAYFALGVGPGKSLMTSPMTFAATANAALYLGAEVRFVDVDPHTGLINPDEVEARWSNDVKLLAVVHYAGALCPMDRLSAIAKKRGAALVEDACHALDAEGYGARAGCFGDIAVFSLHPVKPITSGEGGVAITDSPAFAERMRTFRTHGIVKNEALARRYGPWRNEMRLLGYNYRLSDIHAALGASQLSKADRFLARRRELAARYDAFFAENDCDLVPLKVPDGTLSAYHLYVVLARPGRRRAIVQALSEQGILAQVHYLPVNAHPYYRRLGHKPSDTPMARRFGERVLSLPLFPAMTDKDQRDVFRALLRVASSTRS